MKYLAFIFLLTSCSSGTRLPLVLTGFEGFNLETQKTIASYIAELNAEVGKTLITSSGDGAYLNIRYQHEIKPIIVGRAIMDQYSCTVLLTEIALEEQLLKPILWHELAHCMGFGHEEEEFGEIMSPYVLRWDAYEDTAINYFINQLAQLGVQ